jgi:uncharacterized protein (TIRG00374 family)
VSRRLRIALQALVSAAILGILLWQIDLPETADLLASINVGFALAALVVFIGTTWAMAWRWQLLLGSKGIHEPLGWLTRLYFISYAAGQVLPTAVGGDAVRIVEHARRRPDAKAEAAAAVVMERVIGAVSTLLVAAVGIAAVAGRYRDARLVASVEAALVGVTIIFLALVFSRRTGRHLVRRVFPLGRRLRLERPVTNLYFAMHEYRQRPGVLLLVLGVTLGVQAARFVGIWFCGEAVGIDVAPIVYFVLGPLLFVVQMAPFTLNGLGVREAFFVAFLVSFDVDRDAAFATGFLFYALTIATALPGALILLWRSMRPAAPRPTG